MTKKIEKLVHSNGTDAPWYSGWDLTEEEREVYRQRSINSKKAKREALKSDAEPLHPIYTPRLNPEDLMPLIPPHGLRALSLFSGGGGLDIGFERAGYDHVASYEHLSKITDILAANRPDWTIFGGEAGDVRTIDWTDYRGNVDVIHGGPPCQPFSLAGRQNGQDDLRDMIPEFIRAVLEAQPQAFVMENVAALAGKKFESYLNEQVYNALQGKYHIHFFDLEAPRFGVPQTRRRVFFVGFRDHARHQLFQKPSPTHSVKHFEGKPNPSLLTLTDNLPRCMGAREALGLPNTGFDDLAPTMRSGLTGPRQTTSVLSSSAAQKKWAKLEIWPNGVGRNREKAQAFPAKNGHYRLSIADCAILQGFPEHWNFGKAVYLAIGQIGNSVAPPVAYQVALAVAQALA